MGQCSPYKPGQVRGLNEEDSSLDESDEDIYEDEMSDENFKALVVDMVRQITESSYSVDCAMINLLQIKH